MQKEKENRCYLVVFLSNPNPCIRISRLKERLGCEPSDEQLATSLRISRAQLQSKLIECSLAREKLAMSNVRLVMSIAQRYDNMGTEMADLIQVIFCSFNSTMRPRYISNK